MPARGARPGLHVVAGADSYLAEEALESLLAAAVGGASRADAVQVFRGDEATWSQVVEAARTGSLFAPRRAVVVRNADALKGDGEEMVAYVEDPDSERVPHSLDGQARQAKDGLETSDRERPRSSPRSPSRGGRCGPASRRACAAAAWPCATTVSRSCWSAWGRTCAG